jgi:hypothetical protein
MGSKDFYRYAVKRVWEGVVWYQLTTNISHLRKEVWGSLVTIIGIDLNEELSYPFQRILRAIAHWNTKNAQQALMSYIHWKEHPQAWSL